MYVRRAHALPRHCSQEYIFKGRLVGAFYDQQGNVTMMLRKVRCLNSQRGGS